MKSQHIKRIRVKWLNKLSGSSTAYEYLAALGIEEGDIVLAPTVHGPALASVEEVVGTELLFISSPSLKIIDANLNHVHPDLTKIHVENRRRFLENRIEEKATKLSHVDVMDRVARMDEEGSRLVNELNCIDKLYPKEECQ